MRIAIILGLAILLSGCGGGEIVRSNKFVSLDVPPALLNCPLASIGNPQTDRDVARLLQKLVSSNRNCHANMGALNTYILEYNSRIEKQ